jgi:hypothetical protein
VVSGVVVAAGGLVGLVVLQEPPLPAGVHDLAVAAAEPADAPGGE